MRVITDMHHIQKYIMKSLTLSKWARFRDMRPPRVDSNLYNYHLKILLREKFIEKRADRGYRLSPMGLRHIDHVSMDSFELRWQPKLLTMLYLENEDGAVLMNQRIKQPFIESWTLLNGKVHYEDESLTKAAQREIRAVVLEDITLDIVLAGSVESRVYIEGDIVSHMLTYIYRGILPKNTRLSNNMHWIQKHEINDKKLSPVVQEICDELEQNSTLFYKKFDIDW